MIKKILICITLFGIICCAPTFKPDPASPTPVVITDSSLCSDACQNLLTLKCEEANPVITDNSCKSTNDCDVNEICVNQFCQISCESFCRSTQDNGVWLNPGCVTKITSCKEIDVCQN